MKLDLNVTCSYSVGLTLDIPDDIPENVARRLAELAGEMKTEFPKIEPDRDSNVADWLNDKIHERDAYEWNFTLIAAEILPDNEPKGGEE